MQVNKNEQEILLNALSIWEAEGKITPAKAEELKAGIQLKKTVRQQIAQYFFIIALSCTLLAFAAIFLNGKILEKLKIYFSLGNIAIAILTGAIAILWFWFVVKRTQHISAFAYEAYLLLGSLAALTSLVYLCKTFTTSANFSIFFLLAGILLFTTSTLFLSKVLWQCGLFAFIIWFGLASVAYSSSNLFLGMNIPLRFAVFGIVLTSLSFLQAKINRIAYNARLTYLSGLLLFFTAAWAVSIFGNFNYIDQWQRVRQTNELVYGISFGIISIITFFLAWKYKDELTKDIAIIFLLINIYTRYFEFFWDSMNKGVFFLILAITFGILGWWLDKNHKVRKNKPV